jgi:hypothetical protein
MSNARPLNGVVSASERVVMVVGNYGSGKTEAAVNLALHLAKAGRRVQIADLDIVNPYFRSREARRLMEQHGIRVVVPPGDQAFADLPIILPEIRGMLNPPEGVLTLFDVGGDDVGARVLSAFRPTIREGTYQLWQVINARRPFSDSVAACLEMHDAIRASSRLEVTGVVANTHLMDETDEDVVLEGVALARAVATAADVPLRMVAVMDELADRPRIRAIEEPVLRLHRRMLPPWLTPTAMPSDALPAARPVPIGKPTPARFGCGGGSCHG